MSPESSAAESMPSAESSAAESMSAETSTQQAPDTVQQGAYLSLVQPYVEQAEQFDSRTEIARLTRESMSSVNGFGYSGSAEVRPNLNNADTTKPAESTKPFEQSEIKAEIARLTREAMSRVNGFGAQSRVARAESELKPDEPKPDESKAGGPQLEAQYMELVRKLKKLEAEIAEMSKALGYSR